MGLFDFFRGGQNPHLVWWTEPRLYHARLRYTSVQLAARLGICVGATSAAMLAFGAVVGDRFAPAAVLGLGVLLGVFAWLILIFRHDMKQGKVRAREHQLEREALVVSVGYYSMETETWPYEAVDECLLIPASSIGQPFSLMLIHCDGNTDLIGIPSRIKLDGLARHLEAGGVPVAVGNKLPRVAKERTPAMWYFLWACLIPIAVVATLAASEEPRDKKQEVAAEEQVNQPEDARQAARPREPSREVAAAVERARADDGLREQQRAMAEEAARYSRGPSPSTMPPAGRPRDFRPPGLPRPSQFPGGPSGASGPPRPEPPSEPAVLEPPAKQTPEFRTWEDATGTFKVEARLIRLSQGKVTLQRRDGRTVDVPLDNLSEADLQYIAAQVEANARRH